MNNVNKNASVSEFSQGNDVNNHNSDYIVTKNSSGQRVGVAKGEFEVPDDFDEWGLGFGDI